MTDTFDHIKPEYRFLMSRKNEDRIKHVLGEYWVDYKAASAVLNWASLLLHTPARTRPPCVLIIGDPLTGKSTLTKKILKEYRPRFNEAKSEKIYPIIGIEINENPRPIDIYAMLLGQLGLSDITLRRCFSEEQWDPAARIFKLKKLQVVLMDEFHNLLLASPKIQRQNLAYIRRLINRFQFSILAFGTREAESAISLDDQLNTRFDRLHLSSWKESEDFRSFLAGYETCLPLRYPSNLSKRETVRKMLSITGGSMGGVVERIRLASAHAIITGRERIDIEMLEASLSPPDLAQLKLNRTENVNAD